MLYAVNSTERTKTPIHEFMPLLTDPELEKPEIYTPEEKQALYDKANERLQMIKNN